MKKNMYSILDTFILRSASLPVNDFSLLSSYENREQLVKNPYLRECIAISSPSLFNMLENDNDDISEGLFYSIAKYYIRMTTRSTPFGLLAGIDRGEFSEETQVTMSNINNFKKFANPSTEWLFQLVNSLEQSYDILKQLYVSVNNSSYDRGGCLILPYKSGTQKDLISVSIKKSKVLETIINYSTNPILVNELINLVKEEIPNLGEREITNFILNLVQNQILLSNLRPSLTIENPFNFIIKQLSQVNGITNILDQLTIIKTEIEEYSNTRLGEGEKILTNLYNRMNSVITVSKPLKVDLALNTHVLKLEKSIKNDIENAAEIFVRLSPVNQFPEFLKEYRNKFIEKYGSFNEIPLLEMLDPILGIGSPENYLNESREYLLYTKEQQEIIMNWYTDSLLAQKIEKTLSLEEIKNSNIWNNNDFNGPNSLDLCLKITKNKNNLKGYSFIIGSNPGSTTASNSLNRFKYMFEQYEVFEHSDFNKTKDLDEIIVETVYMPVNLAAANVMLVENKCSYELAIGLNTNPDKISIPLSDILVGCTHDFFYLKSKKYNKEIIPKISHMVSNQNTPDFYRFICEIGLYKCKTWSLFDWGPLKKMPFLPRLRIENIIISPATWKLKKGMLGEKNDNLKKNLAMWREKYKVPKYIYYGENDRRLLLDLDSNTHQNILLKDYKNLLKDEHLTIYERAHSFDDNWVQGLEGNYETEFTFSLRKKEQSSMKTKVVNKTLFLMGDNRKLDKETTSIGDRYLLIKLYGITKKDDHFIKENLSDFIFNNNKTGWFNEFFFLRYSDPDNHLRIRFKGEKKLLIEKGIPLILKWSETLKQKGIISKVIIDHTEPEIVRYGGEAVLDSIDTLFYLDSLINFEWLDILEKNTIYNKKLLSIISIVDFLSTLDLNLNEQLNLIDSIIPKNEYISEYRNNKAKYLFYTDNKENFKNLRSDQLGQRVYKSLEKRKYFIKEFNKILTSKRKSGQLLNDTNNILISIIHLNLNRLGLYSKKEIEIYKLLKLILRSKLAIEKNSNEVF